MTRCVKKSILESTTLRYKWYWRDNLLENEPVIYHLLGLVAHQRSFPCFVSFLTAIYRFTLLSSNLPHHQTVFGAKLQASLDLRNTFFITGVAHFKIADKMTRFVSAFSSWLLFKGWSRMDWCFGFEHNMRNEAICFASRQLMKFSSVSWRRFRGTICSRLLLFL